MDLNRPYRNPSLESKRQNALRTQAALETMRAARNGLRKPRLQVQRALAGERCGEVGRAIVGAMKGTNRSRRDAFRRVLEALLRVRSKLIDEKRFVAVLFEIAGKLGASVRDVESWGVNSHNVDRQLASLLRHLFALYPMPAWFDSAWKTRHDHAGRWRDWYIQVGSGSNLRAMCDLPFPLTKKMAHWIMQAPASLDVEGALRWGQVCGLGGNARLADAIVASSIDMQPARQEFWTTVVHFLVNNPMLDPHQVGPMIDYIFDRRFQHQPAVFRNGQLVPGAIPEPNFSMKGRTVDSLMRQMQTWHRQLARVPRGFQNVTWDTCGIAGLSRVEGLGHSARLFTIHELLSAAQLIDEGRTMRHCVGSYAHSCAAGRCAIYALRIRSESTEEPLVTIEVIPSRREIVQVRGRNNRLPEDVEKRIIRIWAVQASLTPASYCRI